ncbi:MAG: UDP-N-acetylglucosamine 1-carboxyvinyltransferase [Candidatus Cloacimonetes bacterium]|nr:UDP-N-acetylglucosamine 1-carboxyvinyltransferase [Candidatus Cloacimonadota bacterium]
MDSFLINGGKKLSGSVAISGSKNAILPVMAAALLCSGKCVLHNVPHLLDFKNMANLLVHLGAKVTHEAGTMTIDTCDINVWEAPYELVSKMRASIYVMGPLLGRLGKAIVSFPGGCAIGSRPVDFHLSAFEKLGARIMIEHGNIYGYCPDGLKGAVIDMPFPSVGATASAILCSVISEGETLIKNVALEPEIDDSLIDFLTLMGAKINRINDNELQIIGVKELYPAEMTMVSDRIEAGTFLLAGAITKSNITITNCEPKHQKSLLEKLEKTGCTFAQTQDTITIFPAETIKPIDITTAPYPAFPTDLQAQYMACMTLADGSCKIKETIYPDRFLQAAELNRLGANITVKDGTATVLGVKQLSGAEVMASDLRASAALILAGLVAEGTTKISRIYHIDRGYEKIEDKLGSLGADIQRIVAKR